MMILYHNIMVYYILYAYWLWKWEITGNLKLNCPLYSMTYRYKFSREQTEICYNTCTCSSNCTSQHAHVPYRAAWHKPPAAVVRGHQSLLPRRRHSDGWSEWRKFQRVCPLSRSCASNQLAPGERERTERESERERERGDEMRWEMRACSSHKHLSSTQLLNRSTLNFVQIEYLGAESLILPSCASNSGSRLWNKVHIH